MREIEPEKARRRLGRVAQQVVVVRPSNGDKQVAHRITELGGPERQERREGRDVRRSEVQHEYRDKDGEDAVAETVSNES